MKEIRKTFSKKFGSYSGAYTKIFITANNIREPQIDIKNNPIWATTKEIHELGKWLIDIAKIIEDDNDFKNS